MQIITSWILKICLIMSLVTPYSYAQSCPSGQYFDGVLNRCLVSEQVTLIQTATRGCMAKPDEASQRACYIENANAKLAESGKQASDPTYVSEKLIGGNNKNKQGIIVASLGLVVAIYAIASVKTKIQACQSSSLWFMLGGALAAAASEISSWLIYKNGLKKLDEKYKSLVQSEDNPDSLDQKKINATNAQLKSFEYLAEKEELTKKVANIKGGVYSAAAAMFAAAAVISAVEAVKQSNPATAADQSSTCTGVLQESKEASGGGNGGGLLGFLGQALGGVGNLFKSNKSKDKDSKSTSKPEDGKQENQEEKNGSGGASAIATTGVTRTLVSPYTRIVANGVFAGFSVSLASHAFKEAKKADDRAKYMRTLQAEMEQGGGLASCTPQDRNYPEKASCYCYYETGEARTDRENSALCQKKWNKNYQVADSGSYNTETGLAEGPYGCVNRQMDFDEQCKCREQKLRNGENNCMKIQPTFNNMGNLGSANWVKDLKSTSDALSNGSTSGGQINSGSMLKQAANLLKMKDEIIAKSGDKKLAEKIKDIEKKMEPQLTNFSPATLAAANAAFSGGGLSLAKASDLDNSFYEKLKEKMDFSKGVDPFSIGSKKTGSNNAGENYDLGLDGEQSGVTVDEKVSEILGSDLNLGDSDISKDKSQSIFEVVSLRYQVSGLKRLFGGELVKPEEDSKPKKIEEITP